MGYLCDFCGEQRSIVYCRSDAANLCLSCDRNVHSANALSKRHSRTLSCERCKSQPAFVRCIEEKISLCQNCDWALHAGSNTSPSHKRQAVNCYSGCPSAAELSAIWSFLLDSPSIGESTCEKEMGSLSITEGEPGGGQAPQGSNDVQDRSSLIKASRLHNKEKKPGSASYAMPKVFSSGSKKPATVYEDNVFFDDFNMDEVDLGLENYEELFGGALNDHEQLFDSDGIDGIFRTKDMSGSNIHGDYTAERSKVMQQPEYSTAASADSIVSCKTEPPNLYFTTRPANSSISFSGLGGECSTEDYQDCGVSSDMIIMGEPPWQPPCPESSIPSSNRNDAVIRYMEKKKRRKFDKKVRYESRKARADVRKRVKGRFVKAGDAYDYDPLCETRSY